MSIQEAAFQTFVFGRLREPIGFPLSSQQKIAYAYHNQGIRTSKIARLMGITVSSVHTLYSTIKVKGWMM